MKALLDAEPDLEVTGEADDGAEGVEVALERRPDVVLMDVEMPVLDGIEATKRIMAAGSRARVLVVTNHDDDQLVLRALRAGATGFFLKDAAAEPAGARRSAPSRPATRCSRRRSPSAWSTSTSARRARVAVRRASTC